MVYGLYSLLANPSLSGYFELKYERSRIGTFTFVFFGFRTIGRKALARSLQRNSRHSIREKRNPVTVVYRADVKSRYWRRACITPNKSVDENEYEFENENHKKRSF